MPIKRSNQAEKNKIMQKKSKLGKIVGDEEFIQKDLSKTIEVFNNVAQLGIRKNGKIE